MHSEMSEEKITVTPGGNDRQQVPARPRGAQVRAVRLDERGHLRVARRHHVGEEQVLKPDPASGDHGREREPHAGDRYDVVVEQRAGDRDPDHELDDGPGLERAAERDLQARPGDHDGGEPAPELEPERMHVGRGAADDAVEHHVQEALEVLELVGRDLRGNVRIDGLLHGLVAPVERRDLQEQPVAERVAVPERGVAQRAGHRVGAHPALAPLGELLKPREFGLLRPARLPGGLMREHLGHARVDPALAQRGSDPGLLECRVREIAVRGQAG